MSLDDYMFKRLKTDTPDYNSVQITFKQISINPDTLMNCFILVDYVLFGRENLHPIKISICLALLVSLS